VHLFVQIGEKIFPEFKFKWFAEEIDEILNKELDFRIEV
jgi:predicted unusual protein kinase regulating ubiquinone biosynthesis (AarF/ABC1/UbiB family)